jgi:hypothetical protein
MGVDRSAVDPSADSASRELLTGYVLFSGKSFLASASVAHGISRLAKKIRLTGSAFVAAVQMSAEEIAALSPAADDGDDQPVGKPQLSPEAARAPDDQGQIAPVRAPLLPAPVQTERAEPPRRRPRVPRSPPSGSDATARSAASLSQKPVDGGDARRASRCWRTGRDSSPSVKHSLSYGGGTQAVERSRRLRPFPRSNTLPARVAPARLTNGALSPTGRSRSDTAAPSLPAYARFDERTRDGHAFDLRCRLDDDNAVTRARGAQRRPAHCGRHLAIVRAANPASPSSIRTTRSPRRGAR